MSRYLVEKTKTTGQGWQSSNRYFENCGERSLGQFLSVSFLVAYYILPQYFGIRLPGFDLTAQRMLITILCLFLLSKESRKKMFWEGVRSCRLWLFMAGYLGICFYTAVLRFHIGTFLYPFIELLGAFLVIYVLREYLGSDGFLVLFRRMLLFLCVLGLVEAVMRKTPFAYLETIRGLYTGGMIRSGSYRIMGPANHSLAYGLILISGLPLLCIDEEKHCFTLFRHLPLLLLVVVNVFLTGSRSTLAVMGLELLLLTVLAPGEQRSVSLPTVKPMIPTIIRVNGAHRVHPERRSKRPIPIPPAMAPVFFPNKMAPMNNGTFPRWISPPLAAIGSLTLINAVKI